MLADCKSMFIARVLIDARNVILLSSFTALCLDLAYIEGLIFFSWMDGSKLLIIRWEIYSMTISLRNTSNQWQRMHPAWFCLFCVCRFIFYWALSLAVLERCLSPGHVRDLGPFMIICQVTRLWALLALEFLVRLYLPQNHSSDIVHQEWGCLLTCDFYSRVWRLPRAVGPAICISPVV